MELAVYVPVEGSAAMAGLPRGCALLGDPSAVRNGRILLTYEGGSPGSLGIRGFLDMARAAAERYLDPTRPSARLVDVGHVVRVATYDADAHRLTSVLRGASLSLWSGEGLAGLSGATRPVGFPSYDEIGEALREGRLADTADGSTAFVTSSGRVVSRFGDGYEVVAPGDPRLAPDPSEDEAPAFGF